MRLEKRKKFPVGSALPVVTILVIFLLANSAFAWGPKGHQMIGEIAQKNLTPAAQKALKSLMGDKVDLGKESNWPDEIRPNKAYARFRPWHYVDMPAMTDVHAMLMSALSVKEKPIIWSAEEDTSINFIDDLRQFSPYLLLPHAPEGDAIQASNEMAWLLSSPRSTPQERIFALRYLVHIIGDIHQPLHNGNGTDMGGNNCQVVWMGKTEHVYPDGNKTIMNLHTVWDDEMIRIRQCGNHECTNAEYIQFLVKEYPATLKKVKAEDYPGVFFVAEWSTEAAALRDAVYPRSNIPYCKPMGSLDVITEKFRPQLGDAYYQENVRTLEGQILKAGIRAAHVLNDLLPHLEKQIPKDELSPSSNRRGHEKTR